jgi:hypothetical protein
MPRGITGQASTGRPLLVPAIHLLSCLDDQMNLENLSAWHLVPRLPVVDC